MDFKHIKGNDIEKQDFGSVAVRNLFSENNYEKLSVAEVELKGDTGFELNEESDILDYVSSGQGEFIVNGERFSVAEGDLVFIPKNTKFKHLGNMKLIVISVPKFNREKRVRFD